MSSELQRRMSENLPGLPMDWRTKKKINGIVSDAGVAILATQAGRRVQEEAMIATSDLVDLARELAGDDPLKAALLLNQVQDYARRTGKASRTILGW